MRTSLNYAARFFQEFLVSPGITGAVMPSSKLLAQQMVAGLDLEKARAVVEFGPGTGVFTEAVLSRLPADCRFFMIEVNPSFVEILRTRYPRQTIYLDSVKNVGRLCGREGIKEVDCVISGLPWASLTESVQNDCLDGMMTVLKPGGQFVTFAYLQGLLLPAGRRFRRKLRKYFSNVSHSKTVWMNIPPAFVYRCRR